MMVAGTPKEGAHMLKRLIMDIASIKGSVRLCKSLA